MNTLREVVVSLKRSIEELEGVLDALQKIVGEEPTGIFGGPVTGVMESQDHMLKSYSTVTGYHPGRSPDVMRDNEPWIVTHKRANLLMPRVRYLLYRNHSRDYIVLEPFITTEDMKELVTLVGQMTVGSAARMLVQKAYEQYIFVSNDYETLFISRVPKNIREYWPFLQRQLNAFEYKELPAWQQALYIPDGGSDINKWLLRSEHEAWAKE